MPRTLNYKRVKNSLPFLLLIIAFFREELSLHVDPLLHHGAPGITETKVTNYQGRNTSIYDNSEELHLQWLIKPKNATLDFIRCFHGYETKPENYFYTCDFAGVRMHLQTELGNRTSHTIWYDGEKAVFQLNISQPRSSDAGVYTCLLHAAGVPQERTARLYVKRVRGAHRLTTMASLTSSNLSSGVTTDITTHKGSAKDKSSIQGMKIAIIVISVVLSVVLVLVFVYISCHRKGISDLLQRARVYIKSKKQRTQDQEQGDCENVPLRHRCKDSNIPNQDMSDTRTENV